MGAMQPVENEKRGQGKPAKRRLSIRLDMTPMVDIAFLLLIFYMVSTVFAAPQSMQINLPESGDKPIDFPGSNLCILRVDADNNCWLSIGDKPGSIRRIERDDFFDSLLAENYNNMLLSTLVKIHPRARFEIYVKILDDFARIEQNLNRDREYLADYLVVNLDTLGPEKFCGNSFSYRYTTAEWNPVKDEKIIKLAQP